MIAGKSRHGLVGESSERALLQRKAGGEPGIFGDGEHMAERRSLGDAARDEVGGLSGNFGALQRCGSDAICRQSAISPPPARAQASSRRLR